MLIRIDISNFITIAHAQLDFSRGTTVLTGETGTGKSILLDAILLALGGRAEGQLIRPTAHRADISLSFDVSQLPVARQWLQKNELGTEECLIRRTLMPEGRSRSYINDVPVTQNQLRALGEHLVHIHSQHQQHALLQSTHQLERLDLFAGHMILVANVRTLAQRWHTLQRELLALFAQHQKNMLEREWLKLQLDDINQLQLTEKELSELDHEHKKLSHADTLRQQTRLALQLLADPTDVSDNSLERQLQHAIQALQSVRHADPLLDNWLEQLTSAQIQLRDVASQLRDYPERIDLDPARLAMIDARLTRIFDMARKYKVSPEKLFELQQDLQQRLQQEVNLQQRCEAVETALAAMTTEYQTAAKKLSASRTKAAEKLAHAITETLRALALQHADVAISLEATDNKQPAENGLEKCAFLLRTNKGQTLQPLASIASGGELSRISLAIYVASATAHTIPTLVFDEVDTGISGGTAERVGRLLRQLGESHQVLCVTHSPQVAALGHQHLRVAKTHTNNATTTHIDLLSNDEKANEIARMLGGVEMTATTRAHAQEMLDRCLP